MRVERTHAGHQTRYELHDEDRLSCVLTYTADPGDPATWKILLPGPGGTEDLYGTQRFPAPSAAQLTAWLSPIVGPDRAARLAAAVDTSPPPPAGWTADGSVQRDWLDGRISAWSRIPTPPGRDEQPA